MSENIEPGTREEAILSAIAEGETTNIDPATREEALLCAIANGDKNPNIDPATRKEALLKVIAENGSGGGDLELVYTTEKYTASQGNYVTMTADDHEMILAVAVDPEYLIMACFTKGGKDYCVPCYLCPISGTSAQFKAQKASGSYEWSCTMTWVPGTGEVRTTLGKTDGTQTLVELFYKIYKIL